MVVIALRGAWNKPPFLPRFHLVFTHNSRDAIFATAFACFAQRGAETRAAVGFAALLEDRLDLLQKRLVPLTARASGLLLMRVKTARRDFQRMGHVLDLENSF
jgi:hypothetical protein